MTHVKNNSGNNEWYTPSKFIESARLVMGSIDLDPATSDVANKIVKATKYHTIDDSGLDSKWFGNVWMNPPYARDLLPAFIAKLLSSEIKQYITLTNNNTETVSGSLLLNNADAVCFVTGRIKFIDENGNLGKSLLQGQMICYRGLNVLEFISEFSQYGVCVVHKELYYENDNV